MLDEIDKAEKNDTSPVVTQYLKKGRVCVPLNNNSKEPFIKDYLNKTFLLKNLKQIVLEQT